jgi:ubiquinone/menaquinone biosynthesis C-methylase UbiE
MSIYDFFENIYYLISRQPHPNLVDLILKQWNLLKPKSRVIDIGAGEGNLALELLNHVDVHFELCDIDRKKLSSIPLNPSISVNVTDAKELDFPDESFDTAFCINALHHFESPDLSIKEIIRVLKKNGRLLIVDFERQSLLTRTFGIVATLQRRHCRFFTLSELTQSLESLGLKTQPVKINHFQIAVIGEKENLNVSKSGN